MHKIKVKNYEYYLLNNVSDKTRNYFILCCLVFLYRHHFSLAFMQQAIIVDTSVKQLLESFM